MTKVAVAGELHSSNALPFAAGRTSKFPSSVAVNVIKKRKTPSELRGELLKRKPLAEHVDESSDPFTSPMSNADGAVLEPKKSDPSKPPRYIDTQIPYPVTKNSIRHRLLARKEKLNGAVDSGTVGNMNNSCAPVNLYAKRQAQDPCLDNVIASEGSKDNQANNSAKECSNITFPSLKELFSANEKLYGPSVADMDKVFKAVLSCQSDSVDRIQRETPQFLSPEFSLPGHNVPLDLTLKTNMRLQSSSSVKWFHRLINHGTISHCQLNKREAFHSWVYPQSILPRSVIVALNLAGGNDDFLLKRYQAWENSFRSLYYIFRKKLCRIFYVCTEQFVVLFTGGDGVKDTKCSSYAYVSQSTTHLRSILKEHDISFTMPLCQSKVEEVSAEDLVELSEIAKHNLGQTRSMITMAGVDNGPQSLLMITGNKNIHGLYELLLNYRVFLTSLSGDDVPVLNSPVLFENAALSAPQIRCKEVRRVDYESNKESEPSKGSSTGISYSVEITDDYLPPWVISDICHAMRSNGNDFQASFKTKSTSIGLNVGLGVAKNQLLEQVTKDEPQQENGLSFGIRNTTVSSHLSSAYLDELRYGGDSYTASVSRVT